MGSLVDKDRSVKTVANSLAAPSLGCPVAPLFTFLEGFGSLVNPLKQKRVPF